MTEQQELSIAGQESATTQPQRELVGELVGELIERPSNLGVLALTGPSAVLEKASEIATQLAKIIDDKKLFVAIKGKRFVYCEGWTTLGAMLGVTVREVECIESPTKPGEFIATAEAIRTSDGMVIGSASASCGPDEKDWASRSRQARRSMAQTRAAGKAMRVLFSWVMNLAGYAVTPFEEVEGQLAPPEFDNPAHNADAPRAAPRNERVTAATINGFFKRYKAYVNENAQAHNFTIWLQDTTARRGVDFTKPENWTPAMVQAVEESLSKAGPPE
jgi:hypothetical protein